MAYCIKDLKNLKHNKARPTIFSRNYIRRRCKVVNECWEWNGAKDKRGYGIVKHRLVSKKFMYTHRAMYECTIGPIPDNMILLHTCDNPKCCNPKHLVLGTHQENTLDMLKKDRQRSKLKKETVIKIKEILMEEDFLSMQIGTTFNYQNIYKYLAEKYKVSVQTIKYIHQGKTWKHIEIKRILKEI